jgi:hypothetical protein
MVKESASTDAYRIGAFGAILAAVGILASGPLTLPIVAFVQPQPPWDGPDVFVENFHRIQLLPFYFGYFLIEGSILILVSVYLLSAKRAQALIGLIFMSIGSSFAFFNYLTQTAFIPAIVDNYTAELGPIISTLSMSNPIALAWAIEMWAYGFMGLGTWIAAGFFGTSRLERIGKVLFILNGVVSIIGVLAISIDLSGVFSVIGLLGYGAWNLLFFVLALVFFRVLQKRRFEESPTSDQQAESIR